MCLLSWNMIAKISLKCVLTEKKAHPKYISVLMKLNYLWLKCFFIIAPLVQN